MTELDQLKTTLAACRARRLALENYRNATAAHHAAKAASSPPRNTLDTLLGELQVLRADAAKTQAKASKVAAKSADRLIAAAVTASPEAAAKITAQALDHKQGVATRRELRDAYRAASPREKAKIWETFRRALSAYPNER